MRRKVRSLPPIRQEKLKLGKPKQVAAGLTAVRKSFSIGLKEAGFARTWKTMRTVNRFDGYDCPGCAWPDPDDHRSGFEFCENGAKAFATEATKKRVGPEVFSSYSVQELSEMTDMQLDKLGRITEPMYLHADSNHYVPIDWSAVFSMIAEKISDHILGNNFLPPQTVNYKNKTAA